MYIRVTKTVADIGVLIEPEELVNTVDDPTIDWYTSAYEYGEDALDYFKEKGSISGYNGPTWTQTLHWDLDAEGNFEAVREGALKLYEKLKELNIHKGLEIFFSGNKGFHVLVHTHHRFTPKETKRICHNIAVEAGVSAKVFDTTVYNATRIFRVEYTRHQKSGLYKVPISLEELKSLTESDIREIAKSDKLRDAWSDGELVDAEFLKEKYPVKPEREPLNVVPFIAPESAQDFDPMNCPPGKRRCIYVLENGYYEPGTRENAIIRLAAYYKAKDYDKELIFKKITESLEKRSVVYPEANDYHDSDTWRNIDQVFSENWQGGTYSCKTDEFLASKCDLGHGPCSLEEKENSANPIVGIGGLIEMYKQYGEEALKEYPKTGIKWLDQKIRIRPKNFSIWNGANSSGKTSLIIQIIHNLNKQGIYHMFFSADMADTSLFEKLAVKFTDYTYWEVEQAFNAHSADPKIQQEIVDILKKEFPYTLFDFTSSLNMDHIKKSVLTFKEQADNPLDIQIVFVDYAGRLVGNKDSEYANATDAATKANDVAKRTSTHMAIISQIPREQGDHTTPIRSSRVSKSSGAWEENATFAINCWRPFGSGVDGNDDYMHLYIAKSRNSILEERAFSWNGRRGEIRELTDQELTVYESLCETYNKDAPKAQLTKTQQDKVNHSPMIRKRTDTDEGKKTYNGSAASNSKKQINSGSGFKGIK